MKKGWTTTKLIAAGSLGALRLITALPGAAIAGVTGIPFLSGAINFLSAGILYSITCLIIPKFGAATLMASIFSILAIPLPLMGPPGFLPKVILGAVYGLLADIVFLFLKKKKRLASVAIGSISSAFAPIVSLGLGYYLGLPGAIDLIKMFFKLEIFISGAIVGAIAGYLGWLIYSKIENTTIIKRVQS